MPFISYKNTTKEQFVETNSEVSFFSRCRKHRHVDCSDKHVDQFNGEEEEGNRREAKTFININVCLLP